jgi:hypothetical protein
MRQERVLISLYPDLIPGVVGRNQQCRWKNGYLHVSIFLFLIQRLKECMSGNARDLTKSRRKLSSICFLQCDATKEIQAILIEALAEHVPSYAPSKSRGVAHFERGDFSTWDAPRPA